MEIDWKKKYNEALEKIKRYTIDEYGCTRLKPTDIFPELSESEDERIRKMLITLVKKHLVNHERCMAESYLEKQKYSSMSEDTVIFQKGVAEGRRLEREEQKSEWSEEDIERYFSCLKRLGTDNPDQPETINSKWFKEHCYPQPKQEWSKIDEQISNGLIKALENLSSDWLKLHGVIKSDTIAWLKCHHSRLSWKPTDEQMKAFDMVLTDESMDDNVRAVLTALKKQLQKLM